MKIKFGRATALAATITLALVTDIVGAQQADSTQGLDYSLRGGIGYSDNLGRSSGGSSESVFYSIGGRLDWLSDEGRTTGRAAANLDWIDYFESGYDNQVAGHLNANVNFHLIPDRLVWVFDDSFGQGSTDPFASMSPTNSENINYFSTGPDLTFRFGSAMGATLGARYSNAWYEESPNNSDRYSGDVTLFREMSAQSRVFLRGSYQDVQYEESGLIPRDYERADGVLGYQVDGLRTSLDFEGGYSQLEYAGGFKDDGPLFRLTVTRDLSATLLGLLRAGYEYNDSAANQSNQGFLTTNPDGTTNTTATGEIYLDTYGGAELRIARHRTSLSFGGEYHDEDYVRTDVLNRETLRFFAGLSRQISRATSLSANVGWNSTEFATATGADYDDWNAGLGMAWRVSRTVTLDLGYQYYSRGDGRDSGYDENRIWLRAEWSPGASAGATSYP